jgi:hypothetical protein
MIVYEFVTTSSGAVMAEQLVGGGRALELGFGRSGQPRVSAPAGMKRKPPIGERRGCARICAGNASSDAVGPCYL